jgi:hypothetical protein
MTALDTNVLVRYLTQDDEAQFRKVLLLLNRKRMHFFVCDLVLAETDWVLRGLYDWTPGEVADGCQDHQMWQPSLLPPLIHRIGQKRISGTPTRKFSKNASSGCRISSKTIYPGKINRAFRSKKGAQILI